MKNIKQHFQDFRTNTPKHVQWLLLGIAFVVVIILLTLLLSHKNSNNNTISDTDINTSVDLNINPKQIDFTNVVVDTSDNKNIDISANTPVIITDVNVPVKDMKIIHNCDGLVDLCTINVIYKPTSATKKSDTTLKIVWHIESQPNILNTEEVSITYNSLMPEKKPEEIKEQIVQEEPVIEEKEYDIEPIAEDVVQQDETITDTEIIEYDEPYVEEPYDEEPYAEEQIDAVQEIREIATQNPFVMGNKQEESVLTAEKCSDFAIPGYNQSGRQIGWIKPESGANYFHPFSDTDCSNPTGVYDFSTGVITSLKDGSKIGTDSDHIGYRNVRDRNLSVPRLSSPKNFATQSVNGEFENAVWLSNDNGQTIGNGGMQKLFGDWNKSMDDDTKASLMGSGTEESVVSSRPYDRTFILRQFKPIPATIVSEVRADPSVYGCNKAGQNCNIDKNYSVPVRATVDRNVYSDDGRTIILPTGTLLMGYLDGDLPGPYQAFGRMNIKWYQFIRPDGVEFNFDGPEQDPYSGDAQGRMGVPGHGSTDYIEQMVMPILTAMVPAAVNLIAPITDTVINQIDLDNNTIVQSGTIRSSEMAKQDIINTWNKITQKLLVDAIDNTVPPFSIAAGTRINVFSPVDLIVTCGDEADSGKKCAFTTYNDKNKRRKWSEIKKLNPQPFVAESDPSWRGQIRSFNLNQYCTEKNGKITIKDDNSWAKSGYDYRTVLAYCEAQNYQAKNNAKQNAYNQSIQQQSAQKKDEYGITQTWTDDGWETSFSDTTKQKAYNEEVLGLTYDDEGNIENPFSKPSQQNYVQEDIITCDDGSAPDSYGCCAGETYTDMGEAGFNCCPDTGGDCFPPIIVE